MEISYENLKAILKNNGIAIEETYRRNKREITIKNDNSRLVFNFSLGSFKYLIVNDGKGVRLYHNIATNLACVFKSNGHPVIRLYSTEGRISISLFGFKNNKPLSLEPKKTELWQLLVSKTPKETIEAYIRAKNARKKQKGKTIPTHRKNAVTAIYVGLERRLENERRCN